MEKKHPKIKLIVPYIFSIYYLITGLWPIIHIESFMLVTGPKSDIWLVKTVGVLITVVGGIIFLGAWRKSMNLELVILAIGTAIGLSVIDLYYVFKEVISPIYLLDAIGEFCLIILWIIFLLNNRLN